MTNDEIEKEVLELVQDMMIIGINSKKILTFAKKIRKDALNELTFLVWSNEHESWWNPNRRGYTCSIDEAGRYSLKEAIGICTEANKYIGISNEFIPKEVMTLSPESIRALEVES